MPEVVDGLSSAIADGRATTGRWRHGVGSLSHRIPRLVGCSPHVRVDDAPREGVLVVRGRHGPVDGMLKAAGRTLDEFSWRGRPVAAVSAEVTGPDRGIEDVLGGPRLGTRRTYAAAPVADLVAGGFVVLATFAAPHVSIVLPEYDVAHVRSLIAVLGPERTNPRYLRNST